MNKEASDPAMPEGIAEAAAAEPVAPTGREPTTISLKEMSRDARRRRLLFSDLVASEAAEYHELTVDKPKVRGQCMDGVGEFNGGPCPYVSCQHHLYLDVNDETGSLKLNFPTKEVDELEETCSLRVADRGGITLEETGAYMNLTRERIRQVETQALLKLRLALEDDPELSEHFASMLTDNGEDALRARSDLRAEIVRKRQAKSTALAPKPPEPPPPPPNELDTIDDELDVSEVVLEQQRQKVARDEAREAARAASAAKAAAKVGAEEWRATVAAAVESTRSGLPRWSAIESYAAGNIARMLARGTVGR